MELYLKQKEAEIFENVMKKLNKKEQAHEKQIVKKLIKPAYISESESESSESEEDIIQKPTKKKPKKPTPNPPAAISSYRQSTQQTVQQEPIRVRFCN